MVYLCVQNEYKVCHTINVKCRRMDEKKSCICTYAVYIWLKKYIYISTAYFIIPGPDIQTTSYIILLLLFRYLFHLATAVWWPHKTTGIYMYYSHTDLKYMHASYIHENDMRDNFISYFIYLFYFIFPSAEFASVWVFTNENLYFMIYHRGVEKKNEDKREEPFKNCLSFDSRHFFFFFFRYTLINVQEKNKKCHFWLPLGVSYGLSSLLETKKKQKRNSLTENHG